MLAPIMVSAQCESKTVDNGFDPAYHVAYTKTNNQAFLKLENFEGGVVFYLQGVYFCDQETEVDISYMVNGEWEKYVYTVLVSSDQTTLFITTNLLNSAMISSFKNATSVKLRVRPSDCITEIFEFNMSGSTRALSFMSN